MTSLYRVQLDTAQSEALDSLAYLTERIAGVKARARLAAIYSAIQVGDEISEQTVIDFISWQGHEFPQHAHAVAVYAALRSAWDPTPIHLTDDELAALHLVSDYFADLDDQLSDDVSPDVSHDLMLVKQKIECAVKRRKART